MRRYRWRAIGTFCLGLAPIVAHLIFFGFTPVPEDGFLDEVFTGAVGLSSLPLLGGLFASFNSLRIRYLLSNNPWVEWTCRFKEVPMSTPNGALTLLLVDQEMGTEHILSIPTWVWRWRKLESSDAKTVWYAGSPDKVGVMSLPGGEELFWTRRIRFGPWRRRLLRKMMEPDKGVADSPAAEDEQPKEFYKRVSFVSLAVLGLQLIVAFIQPDIWRDGLFRLAIVTVLVLLIGYSVAWWRRR